MLHLRKTGQVQLQHVRTSSMRTAFRPARPRVP